MIDWNAGIVRQFTFSSNLQRMSVIVRRLDESDMTLYCKGAPEKICTLCRSETIPVDFHAVVNEYAQHGYRLIAVARRQLHINFVKAQRARREQVCQ
jgi:cation-transporting ATPase 13A3/4/5